MKLTTIFVPCLFALAVVGCKRERAREIEPVTTTGADVPLAEPATTETVPVPPPQETINQEGDPAAARAREIEAVDITGANRDVQPNRNADPSAGPAARPSEMSSEVKGGALEQPAVNPRDRTGSSFESSGGTSGLGTFGNKVPGQEKFEVKPGPSARDGGK